MSRGLRQGVDGVTEWIGTAEAARRLGIKPATLYSYVSRGILRRQTGEDGRASRFDADEVEVLARRGRPRHSPEARHFIFESSLTEISPDSLRYRGLDVTELAGSHSLEDVAGLLWTGRLAAGDPVSWHAAADAVEAGTAAQAALPAGTLPLERLQVIVPALAAADPLRLHLDPPGVMAAGRSIVSGMVECLPLASALGPRGTAAGHTAGGVAERLWPKLCPDPPAEGMLAALRSALVLLADHELAASTLAARVAASVRADPYAVVATGLGAVGGSLHGGASLGAETMLAAAAVPADAARVVGSVLRRGERVPGFGHFVYQTGDPRAGFLMNVLRSVAPESPRLAVATAMMAQMRHHGLPAPNIDFALAALVGVAGMVTGAGEAIFAIARAVGWIGHAMEEYARRTPLRPRARYTGPRVSHGSGNQGGSTGHSS
jgi:citrate synthase